MSLVLKLSILEIIIVFNARYDLFVQISHSTNPYAALELLLKRRLLLLKHDCNKVDSSILGRFKPSRSPSLPLVIKYGNIKISSGMLDFLVVEVEG